ncbi:hypothetical protein HPB47_003792 [Ixodes persulcatus]|uniref:Uncharacterized protein n=1 Tax=Ixodes persulcatus TaxID=34615 RepID=A0AC60PIG8_IXOPE|nr:hypothetical protein HPB47_003792 [Ixodes persulcatus]
MANGNGGIADDGVLGDPLSIRDLLKALINKDRLITDLLQRQTGPPAVGSNAIPTFQVMPDLSKGISNFEDEALRNAWINAIPRENLIVSQRTKVCERHFSDDDILREVSHVDEVTGRTVTAPLSRVRLRPGAVPSKFPGCPDYLSKHHARREDPDSKRLRQEASAMERALAESIDSFRNEEEADRILSIKDLSDHLKNVKSAFWHAIEGNGHLTLVHIVETEAPWIKYSMSKRVDFLTMSNQRQLVTELTLDLLIDEDCSDFDYRVVLVLQCECVRKCAREIRPTDWTKTPEEASNSWTTDDPADKTFIIT